jgi:steroid delta-isomerase-like uncharacterized protein
VSGHSYDRAVHDNGRIVRDFYDRFNAGDVDGAADQYAEDCEWAFPAFASVCRSRQEVLDVCRSWKAAFPDGRVEIIDMIVCGDSVVVEWDSHGTWTGRLGATAGEPNGKRFRRRGCAVMQLEAGKIIRCRDYFDRANMYAPLGLMHLIAD